MFVSLHSLSIDDLESWRATFNVLLLFCTLAVVLGVYFERDVCPDDVKKYGAALVFRGVAGELLFAAFLWQVDTSISLRNGQIIEDLRSSNLQLEAQIQPRRLNTEQIAAIGSALSKFAGKRVDIGSYVLDSEVTGR